MLATSARASLLGIVCLVSATQAGAWGCGSVLTAPVTLTADLVCGRGQDGLVVGADKVRIDLNGFSLIGPDTLANPTGPSVGVRSNGFESVQIVGPGRITGFERAIEIEGGYNHVVSGVTALAESGLPVSLRNVSGAVVELSRMNALELVSDAGFKAVTNRVVDNEISPEPGMVGEGLSLAGCGTADNVVANNDLSDAAQGAINLREGSHSNQVLKNHIREGEIRIEGSSNNLVAGNESNYTAYRFVGMLIDSSIRRVPCAGNVRLMSKNNIVRDNYLRGGQLGLIVDDFTRSKTPAGNRITRNTFVDMANVGFIFGPGSNGNDGQGNTYVNIPSPSQILDFGSGNLWP